MPDPTYPTARAAAPRVHEHFARHVVAAAPGYDAFALPLPDVAAVEAIIDAAFWASLRREEGYIPRISLALLPRPTASAALAFERPLPLSPASLVKVAPAVERPGIHLGVWPEDGRLEVWGATRVVPRFCFVLEVAGPGLLVVKHHRGETGKFVNVAVIDGDQLKVIDELASTLPDCPALLTSLLGFDVRGAQIGPLHVLVQLAVSMRAHGRGGALLLVPSGTSAWRESLIHPVPYAIVPAFDELAQLVREIGDREGDRGFQDALDDSVVAIAGLTAVDGATLMTDRYELLAFGAKITRRRGSPVVKEIGLTEPIEGSEAAIVHPNRLGGTRHLSASQFVHDQRDAIALVASQDGRFTVFAWSPCEDRVHAHRVETLLL
jgi:hypothetical protein